VAGELLGELGITGWPKTSGNRGVHVYVRIRPEWEFTDVRHAAIGFGRELARRDDQVTTAWWKEERGARIFVDYNQNCRDRTIASAYSLRPIAGAPVSTPVTWAELAQLRDPSGFHLFSVPDRVVDGDPWAGMDDTAHDLEPLLALWREQGEVELNYPPDHPKMPGEPPRVQPSRKVAAHWDDAGNRVE
jgi:DNA primase